MCLVSVCVGCCFHDSIGSPQRYLVEIVPVCKNDIVVIPRKLAQKEGNIPRVLLVDKVASNLHLVDTRTGQRAEIDSDRYWRYKFPAAVSKSQLVRFTVLSVEPLVRKQAASAPKRGQIYIRKMAECEVARTSDLGINDVRFRTITHLGHVLKCGDEVMG